MYNKIINPETNRTVNVDSKLRIQSGGINVKLPGKKQQKKYINSLPMNMSQKKDIFKEIDDNRSTIFYNSNSLKIKLKKKTKLKSLEDFIGSIGKRIECIEGKGKILYVTKAHSIPKVRREVSYAALQFDNGDVMEIVDDDKPRLI